MNENDEKSQGTPEEPGQDTLSKQLTVQGERLEQIMSELANLRQKMEAIQQEHQQMKDDQDVRNGDLNQKNRRQ